MLQLKQKQEKIIMQNPKDIFCGHEKHDYELFKRAHVCPDRKPHDNIPYDVTINNSFASEIGTNIYVKCERCGCMQDITDYSEW